MRYSFVFVPIEIGLEFLLSARMRWLEQELKIKITVESVNEMKFDGLPATVLEEMNTKKYTLLDYLMLKLEMIVENKEVFVVANEPVLGTSKTLLGTMEKKSEGNKSWFVVGEEKQKEITNVGKKNKMPDMWETSGKDDETKS